MAVRGIRGATVVGADEPQLIREATEQLLRRLAEANRLHTDDIISIIFTATRDLTSDFPAHAARRLGWTDVPLLGAVEMDVPGGLARCIRVLLHVNTEQSPAEVRHVYLGAAARLRPEYGDAGDAPA